MGRDFWRDNQSADCPVIDVHAHMGSWNGIYFLSATHQQMFEPMGRAGVEKVVFSTPRLCRPQAARRQP
jgi:hypothetical protein